MNQEEKLNLIEKKVEELIKENEMLRKKVLKHQRLNNNKEEVKDE